MESDRSRCGSGSLSQDSNRAVHGSEPVENADLSALLHRWRKVTDCSFQSWLESASLYEKETVAKLLGRSTAGKCYFEKMLEEAKDLSSTAPPGQTVQQVYENTETEGFTLRRPWKPDFVIHPDMMSEGTAVRPNLLKWPVPPSRALN